MQQAESGDADALKAALEIAPAGLADWKNEHDFTALMHACAEGHIEATRALLHAGASVDICNPQRETALHLASSLGHIEVVRLLLAHGADSRLRTASGATPAELAETIGHVHLAPVWVSSATSIADTIPALKLALPASASKRADPRDAAYALLESEVAELTSEGLDELETILKMMLERVGAARSAAAAVAAIPEVITPRLASPMEQRFSASTTTI